MSVLPNDVDVPLPRTEQLAAKRQTRHLLKTRHIYARQAPCCKYQTLIHASQTPLGLCIHPKHCPSYRPASQNSIMYTVHYPHSNPACELWAYIAHTQGKNTAGQFLRAARRFLLDANASYHALQTGEKHSTLPLFVKAVGTEHCRTIVAAPAPGMLCVLALVEVPRCRKSSKP